MIKFDRTKNIKTNKDVKITNFKNYLKKKRGPNLTNEKNSWAMKLKIISNLINYFK